jgi:hypothetical protein
MPLLFRLRNATMLFELEIMERMRRARPPSTRFVGAADYAPTIST